MDLLLRILSVMAFFNDTSMYGIGEVFVISELIDNKQNVKVLSFSIKVIHHVLVCFILFSGNAGAKHVHYNIIITMM